MQKYAPAQQYKYLCSFFAAVFSLTVFYSSTMNTIFLLANCQNIQIN